MDKSDVEMEDAEKKPQESADKLPETEIKSVVAAEKKTLDSELKAENEMKGELDGKRADGELKSGGEELVDNAITNENVAEEANGSKTDVAGKESNLMSDVAEQDKSKSEVEGPVKEKSETEGKVETMSEKPDEMPIDGKPAERSSTEKTSIVEKDMVAAGEGEKNTSENGKEVENVAEEKPIKNVAIEEGVMKEKADAGKDHSEAEEGGPKEVAGTGKDGSGTEGVSKEDGGTGKDPSEKTEVPSIGSVVTDKVQPSENNAIMEEVVHENEDKAFTHEVKKEASEIVVATPVTDHQLKLEKTTTAKHEAAVPDQQETSTPVTHVRYTGPSSEERGKAFFTQVQLAESDDGTPEEQAAFMKELDKFYKGRSMDFKPPKFYGHPLNCLKLWRAVLRLGGYDRVTGTKLWRQVGESFHPPKTCTTVSWTFRIFYEKSLLEYEKHLRESGELELPVPSLPEVPCVENEGNGHQGSASGRVRRDSAARAMQGWHAQKLFTEDKNNNNTAKREKTLKSIGSLKQKRPNEIVEYSVKAARTETSKQLVTSVVDVGPPADWVKINVRQTSDCFEVYALVPGLLREEVRVQSDPAGRLVITGQPEQHDNPWGVTPFKKVVSLPARIDPLKTSAVVSLHGRLFVRVPFEQ